MINFSKNATYSGGFLRMFGDNLDPEKVSSTIGVLATKSYKKGDVFSQGKNIRKNGMWGLALSSGSGSPSDDIKKIAEIIPKNLLPISNIDGVLSGRLSFYFDGGPGDSTFEIDMDQSDMEFIKNIGVQLSVTYFQAIEEN